MLKVMTILGTRPELIKMSRVIAELDKHTQHILVHSGQNFDYELNQVFFDDLEIRKPDHFLNVRTDRPSTAIADVITKSDELFEQVKPDAILIYGDTNTGLCVIPAKRRKIPVFHMEAGNRCFDQRVPEELNRKVIDHLSDINMVLTEHARRYLMDEGIKPETIIKTGSHMEEVLAYYMPKVKASKVLDKLGLTSKKYFVVSTHREENVDSQENLKELLNSLQALADQYKLPIIVSTHPRTQKRLSDLKEFTTHPLIRFEKPFGLSDYLNLQMNAACVLSDSGTITEESSLMGFPAITIRNAHERPEGMDVGTLIMSGLKKDRVLSAVGSTMRMNDEKAPSTVPDYLGGEVSKQVVKVVMSYADYVNRTVWSKSP